MPEIQITKRPPPPTHKVYYVEIGRDGREGRWLELGAAWQHQDGQGLELFLDVLPIGGFRGRLRVKAVGFVPPSTERATEGSEQT
jgi:hypothetical protein